MPRGALIVFEGADRSGKTTQTHRLVTALSSNGVQLAEDSPWRFPDRTTDTGKMINGYLTNTTDINDKALHLLFSANRWEKASKIRSALERGKTVILDRYAYSGIAYSVAKGLDINWCKAADAGLPAPDVVLYLELSPEAAARRGDFGKERYENDKMQNAVSEAFAGLRTKDWRIIDADADQDTVFKRISDAVMPVTATLSDTVGTLWS